MVMVAQGLGKKRASYMYYSLLVPSCDQATDISGGGAIFGDESMSGADATPGEWSMQIMWQWQMEQWTRAQ